MSSKKGVDQHTPEIIMNLKTRPSTRWSLHSTGWLVLDGFNHQKKTQMHACKQRCNGATRELILGDHTITHLP
jgi:hypothetical protein